MNSYNRTLRNIGSSARKYYFAFSGDQQIKENYDDEQDLQIGGLVLFLLLLVSFLTLWSLVAVVGNASVLTEKMTFIAVLLLFLTPIFPFAPVLSLLVVYRTRAVNISQAVTRQCA